VRATLQGIGPTGGDLELVYGMSHQTVAVGRGNLGGSSRSASAISGSRSGVRHSRLRTRTTPALVPALTGRGGDHPGPACRGPRGRRDSDRTVSLVAGGSLSHRIHDNRDTAAGIFTVSGEFYRQVDLRVVELWEQGRWAEFVDMLPDYARTCHGEGMMHDTAMLFGAFGWRDYRGSAEILTPGSRAPVPAS